jgi:hypothetical protein
MRVPIPGKTVILQIGRKEDERSDLECVPLWRACPEPFREGVGGGLKNYQLNI